MICLLRSARIANIAMLILQFASATQRGVGPVCVLHLNCSSREALEKQEWSGFHLSSPPVKPRAKVTPWLWGPREGRTGAEARHLGDRLQC